MTEGDRDYLLRCPAMLRRQLADVARDMGVDMAEAGRTLLYSAIAERQKRMAWVAAARSQQLGSSSRAAGEQLEGGRAEGTGRRAQQLGSSSRAAGEQLHPDQIRSSGEEKKDEDRSDQIRSARASAPLTEEELRVAAEERWNELSPKRRLGVKNQRAYMKKILEQLRRDPDQARDLLLLREAGEGRGHAQLERLKAAAKELSDARAAPSHASPGRTQSTRNGSHGSGVESGRQKRAGEGSG